MHILISGKYPVHIRVARIFTDHPFMGTGGDLRRAITALFPNNSLLHHHGAAGKVDYSLSQVRYLVLDGVPHLVGLEKGGEVISGIADKISLLTIGQHRYRVTGIDFIEDGVYIGSNDLLSYTSRTPWIALNQRNLAKFNQLKTEVDRCRLLERILIGNFLSLAKGLDVHLEARLQAKITNFNHRQVNTPVPMLGFKIQFVSNFLLPEFLGVGKMVSKGFGLMNIR